MMMGRFGFGFVRLRARHFQHFARIHHGQTPVKDHDVRIDGRKSFECSSSVSHLMNLLDLKLQEHRTQERARMRPAIGDQNDEALDNLDICNSGHFGPVKFR